MGRDFPDVLDPVTAFTRPDGTTEGHNVDHGRAIGMAENVKAWGAVGDGVADDTQKIQDVFNAIPTSGGAVFFPPGVYKVSSPLILPTLVTDGGSEGRIKTLVSGYNATIYSTSAIQLMRTLQQSTTGRYVVEGLAFKGNGTAGQKGLQFCGTYGGVIRECTFSQLDIGIDLVKGLMTRVENVLYQDNGIYDILIRSATNGPDAPVFAGSSDFTASNVTYLIQNRHYCRTGCDAAVKVIGSSGIVLDGEIFEGGLPDVCFDFDDNLSGNARGTELRNCWFEYGSPTTILKYRTQHAQHLVRWCRFHSINAASILVDMSNSYNNQGVTFEDCQLQGLFRGLGSNNTTFTLVRSGRDDAYKNTAYWYNATINAASPSITGSDISLPAPIIHAQGQTVSFEGGNAAQGTFAPVVAGARGFRADGAPPPGGSYERYVAQKSGANDYFNHLSVKDHLGAVMMGITANGAIKLRSVAGAISDGSWAGGELTPSMMALDETNSRLYVRVGTTWKYVTLAT